MIQFWLRVRPQSVLEWLLVLLLFTALKDASQTIKTTQPS
jgi:hypothetical protein